MIIKEFIVNELTSDYGSGECTHFTLKKEGWNTITAIRAIAKELRVSDNRFGYAGLKDKNAVTTQRVSAWRIPVSKLKKLQIRGLELTDYEENKERIRIGTHKGNSFRITISELRVIRKPANVPNLFGQQRFKGTEVLGELLVKAEFQELIKKLRLNSRGSYERQVIKDYEKNNNPLRALRLVDKRIRALWVNAYQAKQWNDNIDLTKKTMKLPSIKEIKGMPELGSFPGAERETIMRIKDFKVTGETISFKLGKGSYATTLIDYITKP